MWDELFVFVSTSAKDMQFENKIIEGDNRTMLGMQSLTIFLSFDCCRWLFFILHLNAFALVQRASGWFALKVKRYTWTKKNNNISLSYRNSESKYKNHNETIHLISSINLFEFAIQKKCAIDSYFHLRFSNRWQNKIFFHQISTFRSNWTKETSQTTIIII